MIGRNDLAIGDTDPGVIYVLKKLGYPSDALTRTPVTIFDADLYIAFSRNTPDGTYDIIAEKYSVQKPLNP